VPSNGPAIFPVTITIDWNAKNPRQNTPELERANRVANNIRHLQETPVPVQQWEVQENKKPNVCYAPRINLNTLAMPQIGIMQHPEFSRLIDSPASRE
jgi:hypothetical protein